MKNKLYLVLFFLVVSLILLSCRKENFLEPPDPFEVERLDPNHKTVQLGEGENALNLFVNNDNYFENGERSRIKGSIFVENEIFGDVRISSGDFEIVQNDKGIYNSFTGYGLVEMPHEGIFKNFGVDEMIGAKFGFQKGSEFDLDDYAWPVNNDRYYFYLDTQSGFESKISNTSIAGITRVAIDPKDPFCFMSGQLTDGSGESFGEVGIGFSAQKKIPFRPLVTSYTIEPFLGEMYLSAEVSLEEYPITIWGESVFSFVEGSSEAYFSGEESAYTMGVNGKILFDHEALDWLDIEVILGQSSLTLDIHDDGWTQLKFVGERTTPSSSASDYVAQVVGQDWDFIDYILPFEQKEVFFGTLGSDPDDWEIGFDMQSTMKIYNNTIDMGHSYLLLTTESIHFQGEMKVNILSKIGVKGYGERNGNFELTGYAKSGCHVGAGGLSFGYDLSMTLTLKHNDGTFTIKGKVKLKGKACVSIAGVDICAKFTIRATVTVSTDGYFEVCFSIGIGRLGFDVCIEYDKELIDGKLVDVERMHYVEIPLEQVPIENRFQPEE